jgi:hypothetical protein
MGQGYGDGGVVILGTYGTNFLICNLYAFLPLPPSTQVF